VTVDRDEEQVLETPFSQSVYTLGCFTTAGNIQAKQPSDQVAAGVTDKFEQSNLAVWSSSPPSYVALAFTTPCQPSHVCYTLHMPNFLQWGQWLDGHMRESHLTNAALAHDLTISDTVVSRYRSGQDRPRPPLLDRIAAYFGDDPNNVRPLVGYPPTAEPATVPEAELDEAATEWRQALSRLPAVRQRRLARSLALSIVRELAAV
jgi:transcriptional regulator with XRE-family HTH domain